MMFICSACDKEIDVPCTAEQYNNWKAGALSQKAMPNISADLRELLISGICRTCFEQLFKEDDL